MTMRTHDYAHVSEVGLVFPRTFSCDIRQLEYMYIAIKNP